MSTKGSEHSDKTSSCGSVTVFKAPGVGITNGALAFEVLGASSMLGFLKEAVAAPSVLVSRRMISKVSLVDSRGVTEAALLGSLSTGSEMHPWLSHTPRRDPCRTTFMRPQECRRTYSSSSSRSPGCLFIRSADCVPSGSSNLGKHLSLRKRKNCNFLADALAFV